jgi:hypothetical protein
MIGGLVEWKDRLLRGFARPRLSVEARVEPAEEDDDPRLDEPGAKAGAGAAPKSLAEDLRDEQ